MTKKAPFQFQTTTGRLAAMHWNVPLLALAIAHAGCTNANDYPAPAAGPLYAVSVTSVAQGFDFSTAMIMSVPSLAEGVADPKTGIEVGAGELRIWPGATAGVVFAVLGEEAAIARYELDSSGRLVATGKLGLASVGITTFNSGEAIRVVSEDKAYFLDPASWQAVVFDPSSMSILDTLDLGGLAHTTTGYFAWVPSALRGNELVAMTYYLDWQAETVEALTRAVFIDTETDEVSVAETTACGGVGYLTWTDSGDLLGAQDTWSAATYRLGRGPAPCMARIEAGSHEFDEGFEVPALKETTLAVGGLVPGPGGSMFMRVLDEELAPVDADSSVIGLFSMPAWRTVRLPGDLSGDFEPVATLAPTAGGLTWFQVDGTVYVNDSAADYTESTLVNMSNPDGPSRGLKVAGVPFGIVRMR